jgi:hypothetical protein
MQSVAVTRKLVGGITYVKNRQEDAPITLLPALKAASKSLATARRSLKRTESSANRKRHTKAMTTGRSVVKRLEAFKKTFARRCVRFSNRCIKHTTGSGGKRTCVQKEKRCSKYVLLSMLAKYRATKKRKVARKTKRKPSRKRAPSKKKKSDAMRKGKMKATKEDIPLSSWKKSKGQIRKQCVALLKLGGKTLSRTTINSALAYIKARPNSSAGHAKAKRCAERLIKSLGASLKVASPNRAQPGRVRKRKQSSPKRAPWFHAPLQRWGAKGKRNPRDWKKKASPAKTKNTKRTKTTKKRAAPARRVTGEDLFGSDDDEEEDDDYVYDDMFVKSTGKYKGVPAKVLDFYYKKYA